MNRLRAEHLLPLACAAACALLAASEFMNTFKLNGPGPSLEVVQSASDQHHYALLVLAGFALISVVVAVVSVQCRVPRVSSRPTTSVIEAPPARASKAAWIVGAVAGSTTSLPSTAT